jgi:hypothetical protein
MRMIGRLMLVLGLASGWPDRALAFLHGSFLDEMFIAVFKQRRREFAAIGVEGGLIVLTLTVYEAANDRTSPRDVSRALDAQDDALPPRNRA